MTTSALFRPEAIEHHAGHDQFGDILRVDRRWPRQVYRLIALAALAGFVFISVVSVHEYASGPAILSVDGRRALSASSAGAVERVAVRPGQVVDQGAVLVQMRDPEALAEASRATRELDLQLVRMLRDPNDLGAKQALASLRAARDQAQNQIDARTLRADMTGVVSDVRVRPGQNVAAGETLLTIAPRDAAQVSLHAMVSADYRPLLKEGLPLRFALDGFKFEYTDVEVTAVSSDAIGPSEVQRLLGHDRGDAFELDAGAKVLVTARLPAATFTSEGQPYGYFDGLTGNAEIRVRAEPILFTLVPALHHYFTGVR